MTWISVRDLIVNELYNRKCEHIERYPDFYIASAMDHLFNLANHEKCILYDHGKLYNTRLHILLVAPPGFSKSFWLDQFMFEDSGVLWKSIPTAFKATMTEAGLVGTIRMTDGVPTISEGVALRHANSIIGVEEFAAITAMMPSSHSKGLDTAFLTSLDSGRVNKDLAAGEISYTTYYSLWAGVQPSRFDLTSGMGRRLCTMEFIPNEEDKNKMRIARREGIGVRFNPVAVKEIKTRILEIKHQMKGIQEFKIDDGIYDYFDQFKFPHFEETIYEKILMGVAMANEKITPSMSIELNNKKMKEMVIQEMGWRKSISRGSQMAEVIVVLKDMGGKAYEAELKDELMAFGLDWEQSQKQINHLVDAKILAHDTTHGIIYLREKYLDKKTKDIAKKKGWGEKE